MHPKKRFIVRQSARAASLLAALALQAEVFASTAPYTLHDIALPAGAFTAEVNDSDLSGGRLVGTYWAYGPEYTDEDGDIRRDEFNHAFYWNESGFIDLVPSARSSSAFSLNASGQVAGQYDDDANHSHLFVWKNGTLTNVTLPGNTDSYPATYLGIDAGDIPFPITSSGAIFGSGSDANTFAWLNGSFSIFGIGNIAAVNSAGAAVGGAAIEDNSYAYLWKDGVKTILPRPGNATSAGATFISETGQILGQYFVPIPNTSSSFYSRACAWSNGGLVDLHPPGAQESFADDINASGQITCNYTTASGAVGAFVWQAGQSTEIPLPTGTTAVSIAGINASGRVLGQYYDAEYELPHAFTWKNGVFTELTPPGHDSSRARGIDFLGVVTDSDRIVCGWILNASRYGSFPSFTWKDGVLTDLGAAEIIAVDPSGRILARENGKSFVWENGVSTPLLPPSAKGSLGRFLTDEGEVAGIYTAASGASYPFLWKNGAFTDLAFLGAQETTVDQFADGKIAGTYTEANQTVHAYLLTPGGSLPTPTPTPEPTPTPTPNPTPAPTATPAPSPTAPTIVVRVKKKITTSKASQLVKGTAAGGVTSVTYRVGAKGSFKKASGANNWKFTAKLKPGKNIITIVVEGPGGKKTTKITVIRKS